WSLLYQIVFYANTVLDGLKGDDHVDARVIRGQALFHRAHTFFQLAQLYSPPYDPSIASDSPGIPLRLTADVGETIFRSSLDETYERIVLDAKEAARLLEPTLPRQSLPSRQAAYGLLARTFLCMGRF